MTILQALNGYYDRLAARGDMPPHGFSRAKISFVIQLDKAGKVIGVTPHGDMSNGKHRPAEVIVPAEVKRTSGIRSNLLWDKTSYVLGVIPENRNDGRSKNRKRLESEHTAFREMHLDLLKETKDEGLVALRKFIENWSPERFGTSPFVEEMRGTNVVFRLNHDKEYIHDRPAAHELVQARITHQAQEAHEAGNVGMCLVTGEHGPIAKVHPSIRGVKGKGAQTSGANIVSFNLDAFTSYGKNSKAQGLNAPVSERATFGYTTALNHLLRYGSPNCVRIGDTTTVFWAESINADEDSANKAEALFGEIVSPKDTEDAEMVKIQRALRGYAEGRSFATVAEELGLNQGTRFHVLGLAPNVSRLSIRFWHTDTIGAIAENVRRHWNNLRIEPAPWNTPPAAWRLLYETAAQRKAENIPPLMGGALMHAILTGAPYPKSLMSTILMRVRADRLVNGTRAAICKACLVRSSRDKALNKGDRYVSLDHKETNPAYRLGRLFAVLERIQRAALGKVNATIRDRYFGAASATPASTFPTLIRNAKNHLKTIRANKGRLAYWFDKRISEIIDGFETTQFPRSLPMSEQGRFVIGYYHEQKDLSRGQSADDDSETENPDNEEEN